jgi:glycogen operon protein
VEAWFYGEPFQGEVLARVVLDAGPEGVWQASLETLPAPWYGLRLWGPNWPWDETWIPGSEAGFLADVDDAGHRFNPNRLVVDPWALEWSHDPIHADLRDGTVFQTGPYRARDSGPVAPKGLVLVPPLPADRPPPPLRGLHEDVVYEVHLRGLTRNDPSVPEALRGTYAGAALLAPRLRALGVTAVEFLPLHETQNDQNDLDPASADGDNYWGYASLSFFAPDRRYAADRSSGGPTRELIAMVDAFHREGIKVFVDVVYNHTGEGGAWGPERGTSTVWSWRGLDNALFYQTVEGRGYRDDNGVGPNLRFTHPLVRRHVMDSLKYWTETIGVDGFRFDLAAVLGNACDEDCFRYSSDGLLREIADAFARRPDGTGVDLIAEPWGLTEGTYQLGRFGPGWSEWNDRMRIATRQAINRPWEAQGLREIRRRIEGSPDLFAADRPGPAASLGYVVSHDGFTWWDLVSCADRRNDQPWPMGPSDGGSTFNQQWDHDGDPVAQRQAARTSFALMALGDGVPMLNGGDEFLRTQHCNNNAYNIDSVANWLDWTAAADAADFTRFVQTLLTLRGRHPQLRPATWRAPADEGGPRWLNGRGEPLQGEAWDRAEEPVLARWLPGVAGDPDAPPLYWAWNRSDTWQEVRFPDPGPGRTWHRVADTAAWLEPISANVHPWETLPGVGREGYGMHPRSLVVVVSR